MGGSFNNAIVGAATKINTAVPALRLPRAGPAKPEDHVGVPHKVPYRTPRQRELKTRLENSQMMAVSDLVKRATSQWSTGAGTSTIGMAETSRAVEAPRRSMKTKTKSQRFSIDLIRDISKRQMIRNGGFALST